MEERGIPSRALGEDLVRMERIVHTDRRIYDPRRWHKSSRTTTRRRSRSSNSGCGQAPAGWVLVWAGRFKRWRRRWFVAHPAGLLLYYKNFDQVGRPGCINLLGARVVPDGVKARQIKIVRGPIVYYLRTTNKDFRQGWLDAISESVRIYNNSLKNVAVGALPSSSESCIANSRQECEQQEKELTERLNHHLRDIEPARQEFLQKLRALQQTLASISETLGFSAETALPHFYSEMPSTPKARDWNRSLFGRRRAAKLKKQASGDECIAFGCRRTSSCPSETTSRECTDLIIAEGYMNDSVQVSRKRSYDSTPSSSKQPSDEESTVPRKPTFKLGSVHAAWNGLQEAYAEALREGIRRVIELEAENAVLQESLATLPQLQRDRLTLIELKGRLKTDGVYLEEKNMEKQESDDDISIVATELTNEEYFEALEVLNQHEFIAKSTALDEQDIAADGNQEPPEEGELDILSEVEVEDTSELPRARLPAPRPLSMGFSLWTVLKNAIGKDLNHITLPATINEPLSALQRVAEQMQFRCLLQSAAEEASSMERLLLVSAFACASYNGTLLRDAKPFNPMLGETYEWQAFDGSARFVSEQVSHHPPVMAFQGESTSGSYYLYGELEIKNKFWGKSVEVLPLGNCHVRLSKCEDHFTWNQVTTCIHNVVMGKPWIDSYGEMTIQNQKTLEYARIRFHKATSKEQGRISGKAYDSLGTALFDFYGNFMDKIMVSAGPQGAARCLWQSPAPPRDFKQQYCFSQFAIGLNELTSRLGRALPPTDSRFRPDQRALEDGDLEKATPEKFRLEEKQRQAGKLRKEQGVEWRCQWFQQTTPGKVQEAGNGEEMEPHWRFNGKYWDHRDRRAWENCPDIM